jgi:hypothetical protein
VYYKGKARTTGTAEFHDELRTAFTSATTVKESARNAWAVAQRWIWNGGRMAPPIHPECEDKNGTAVTAAGQRANVNAIKKHFKKFL